MEQARQSDTWALASPQARPWLLMLWAVAWEQVPCGSLPNDDELIAARLGIELDQFAGMKRVLLRGWWTADDGRLYHGVMISRVLAMLEKKDKDRQRKAGWRGKKSQGVTLDSASVPRDGRVTDVSVPPESRVADATKHQAPSTSNTQANACDAPQSVATKPKRGSRLAADWFLPQPWGQWALDEFPHFTADIVRQEALKFANHWRSKSGKDAAKLDWYATWQNWCMSDICQRTHPPPSKQTETNYARQMRERVEQATGSMAHLVAAKPPGYTRPPEPWEIAANEQHRALAARVGGSDLLEAHGAVWPGLLEPVRGD